MSNAKNGNLRIALQIEINRAHGRSLVEGIADYAQQHTDWRLEMVEPELLHRVADVRKFDGLIVRVMDDATAAALLKSRRPVVDAYGRTDRNPLPSIRLDDKAIAAAAYGCLAEHHFRAFAYCGFPGVRFSDARGDEFVRLASAAGDFVSAYAGESPVTDRFFRDEKTKVPDAQALVAWIESLPKPVAVFCCNDLRAVQVMRICAGLDLNVPKDVAVLGVDNDVLLCTFTNPTLSSIFMDPFALGRQAAAMLDRQLRTPSAKGRAKAAGRPEPHLWPPKKVVERMSTDAYPFRTPWMDEALRFIHRNVANGVNANDVVAHLGYSHPKVNQTFNRELGRTVKREIIRQRTRLACSLLKETDYPIGEISRLCGYQRVQYFVSNFSAEFRLTPEAWRRRFQKS